MSTDVYIRLREFGVVGMKWLLAKWVIGLVVMALFICGLAAPFVPCAQGEIRLKKYEMVKNTESFKNYINGVGIGFFWANAYLDGKELPELYCQPENVALRADDYLGTLAAYIEKYRTAYKDDTPLEMLLLRALGERYPCKD